jgi:hypothetical protein
MTKPSFWFPGDDITIRGVGSKVFWAYPANVVQDTPELIAYYLCAGANGKNTRHRVTPIEMLDANKINIVDHQWHRTDVLMLVVPGEAFSVYFMWETGTKNLDCIYINLQEPTRRTSIGFDSMDNVLDVVIHPDMNEWKWKDEDEFEEAQRVGFYSREQARQIRADGEKAIEMVMSRRRSIYEKWKLWEPDPQWALPLLSQQWDRIKLNESD